MVVILPLTDPYQHTNCLASSPCTSALGIQLLTNSIYVLASVHVRAYTLLTVMATRQHNKYAHTMLMGADVSGIVSTSKYNVKTVISHCPLSTLTE